MHLREQEQKNYCDAEMESLAEEQTGPCAALHLEMLLRAKVKKDGIFLTFDARNDCSNTY